MLRKGKKSTEVEALTKPPLKVVPYSPVTEVAEYYSASEACPLCQRPFAHPIDLTSTYFRSLDPPHNLHSVSSTDGVDDSADKSATVSPTPSNTSHGYYEKYFTEVQKLGHGSFGGVYVCRHIMENVSLGLFAVKKVPVGDGDSTILCNALREIKLLEELHRHPNVIEYHHSWIDFAKVADFGPTVRCLFILMEYATEGSLDQYMQKSGQWMTNTFVWYFFFSMVSGLQTLHEKDILHRDIKPQNLLLTRCEGKPPRLMLSDFGTASLIAEMGLHPRSGGTGTLEYMAPELFVTTGGPDRGFKFRHSKASDMWSVGMVLHYMAFDGELPTILPNGGVAISRACRQRPLEMVELINMLLSHDPAQRPTCEAILRAPFFEKVKAAFERGLTDGNSLSPARPLLIKWHSFKRPSPSPDLPSPKKDKPRRLSSFVNGVMRISVPLPVVIISLIAVAAMARLTW